MFFSWWFDTKYYTQLGVVPCKCESLLKWKTLTNEPCGKWHRPPWSHQIMRVLKKLVTNNVISMDSTGFFHVFSTTVCTDMHQNHHQNHPVTTLSDHPVTSFQSSRCAVVVAMAPFALAAFSSDGKRQAIQPVSEVCWMKRPTSCCLIETSAPEQTGTIPQFFCSVCRIKLHQNWQSHANFTSIYIHTLWQSNPALEHAPFIDDTSVNWWIGNHQKII